MPSVPPKTPIKVEREKRPTSSEFRLPVAQCVFRASALDPIQQRFFMANALRGGLGYLLKELVCSFDTGDCVACPESSGCVYTTTFDTRFALGDDMKASLTSPPPPYALRCDVVSPSIAVGQEFEFVQSLFGCAIPALPKHISAQIHG